jgi:AcrR family transcriptional regulator
MKGVEKPAVSGRRLVHEDVLVAAESIVDRSGWSALTMSALAKELGVKSPSLYHHVDGIDGLRAELQGRTLKDMASAQAAAAAGRSGLVGIRALAEGHREFALLYPHRYLGLTSGVLDREVLTTSNLEISDVVAMIVQTSGIPRGEIDRVMRALFAAVHGAVSLELVGFFDDRVRSDHVFRSVIEGSLNSIEQFVISTSPSEE